MTLRDGNIPSAATSMRDTPYDARKPPEGDTHGVSARESLFALRSDRDVTGREIVALARIASQVVDLQYIATRLYGHSRSPSR